MAAHSLTITVILPPSSECPRVLLTLGHHPHRQIHQTLNQRRVVDSIQKHPATQQVTHGKTGADFPSQVAALQTEAMYTAPSDSGRSEVSRQALGRISRDASLAVDDLVDPPRWHPD